MLYGRWWQWKQSGVIGTLSYLVDEAFKEDIMDELYFVDGVISRKKQIIPTLSKCLESM